MLVSYPGGSARFRCTSTLDIANIQWLLNGISLESLNLRNVTQSSLQDDLGMLVGSTLRFADIPVEYNNTIIQCVTTGLFEASEESVLLLQGCQARCTVQPLN